MSVQVWVKRTLLMGVVVAVATATAAAPATASESYPRPADGVISIEGRGFGHARGLSQYGAKRAAERGLTWQQISEHYYPGTAIGDNRNPLIRVKLSGGTGLAVAAEAGLRVATDGAAATPTWETLPTKIPAGGTAVAAWEVAYSPTRAGWYLRYRLVGATAYVDHLAVGAGAGTVAFDNPTTGVVRRLTSNVGTAFKSYRGALRHVRSSAAAAAGVTIVDALAMEQYLRGVVPNEMSPSWSPEALRAQAVAARTYAEFERREAPAGRVYDTCDTTACQVLLPVETEDHRTDAAIAATASQILTYAGKPAFTQFSASNGGYSIAGGQPYLVAKADPYDLYTWTTSVTAASIEKAWPTIGRLQSLTLVRDGRGAWGGRVTSVALKGSSRTVTVTGSAFSSALGLRQTLFKPTSPRLAAASFPNDVTGDGRADVLAFSPDGVLRTYLGNGAGAFGSVVVSGSGWNGVALGFTAGAWDQSAPGDLMAVSTTGELWLFPSLGNGRFGSRRVLGTGYDVYAALWPTGDFDGDGTTDLLGRRTDGTLWLVKGDGEGGVAGQAQLGRGWQTFTAVFSAGDFTGDGFPDVIARDAAGFLWVYPGTGTGGFAPRVQIGNGWQSFTAVFSAGDFTGDGRADLFGRTADGALMIYPGAGANRFRAPSQVGRGWGSVTVLP